MKVQELLETYQIETDKLTAACMKRVKEAIADAEALKGKVVRGKKVAGVKLFSSYHFFKTSAGTFHLLTPAYYGKQLGVEVKLDDGKEIRLCAVIENASRTGIDYKLTYFDAIFGDKHGRRDLINASNSLDALTTAVDYFYKKPEEGGWHSIDRFLDSLQGRDADVRPNDTFVRVVDYHNDESATIRYTDRHGIIKLLLAMSKNDGLYDEIEELIDAVKDAGYNYPELATIEKSIK